MALLSDKDAWECKPSIPCFPGLYVSFINGHPWTESVCIEWQSQTTLLCSQGLYSSVICPGVVLTNLTYGILPPFVWTLLLPLLWLVSGKHWSFSFNSGFWNIKNSTLSDRLLFGLTFLICNNHKCKFSFLNLNEKSLLFVTALNSHITTIVFFSSDSLFCKRFHSDTVQWSRSAGMLLEF